MIYRFCDCSLDIGRRELWRGSAPVAVEPQVFDLIHFLICHRERVVSKDELIAGVWDGRIVSESTVSSRIAAARHAIGDGGRDQQMIRTVSRRGLRFICHVEELPDAGGKEETPGAAPPDSECEAQPPAARRPSIAILPFASLSGDPGAEAFVDGLIEDISTALAQFRWLTVVTRRPGPGEGWSVDIREAGRDLGVHYAVEGSVRRGARRARVTARLVDCATGAHLWASRLDVWQEDMLDLQDDIAASVVGAIAPKLERVEIDRARREPAESLDAVGCYLRGMGQLYRWSQDGVGDALALFRRAAQIDPEFASAYGMAAYCYIQRKSYGWTTDRAAEAVECGRLAQQAAEFARDDAVALCKAAHAIASVAGDTDSGADFIERALRLNPGLAAGWYVSGWIRLFLGQPGTAGEHLARAMRLGPMDPLLFKMQAAAAYADLLAGRYDDAALWAERALRARPGYLTAVRAAAASHALAGRGGRAQALMAEMRAQDPALRVTHLTGLIPFRRTADMDRWMAGLSKAGLPN